MSKSTEELAKQIYMALHGQQYFIQVRGLVDSEIEEFKANVIADIEAELPEPEKDPYIIGLRESELKNTIAQNFDNLDSETLDELTTQLSDDFDYQSLWDKVLLVIDEFITEAKEELEDE